MSIGIKATEDLHNMNPIYVGVLGCLASFQECFIPRVNEEKLFWSAFYGRNFRVAGRCRERFYECAEREGENFEREREIQGVILQMCKKGECLPNQFLFIHYQNETLRVMPNWALGFTLVYWHLFIFYLAYWKHFSMESEQNCIDCDAFCCRKAAAMNIMMDFTYYQGMFVSLLWKWKSANLYFPVENPFFLHFPLITLFYRITENCIDYDVFLCKKKKWLHQNFLFSEKTFCFSATFFYAEGQTHKHAQWT